MALKSLATKLGAVLCIGAGGVYVINEYMPEKIYKPLIELAVGGAALVGAVKIISKEEYSANRRNPRTSNNEIIKEYTKEEIDANGNVIRRIREEYKERRN